MAGENLTLRSVLRDVLLAAALTGRADPAPLNRPWPLLLRWTRYIGVGRLPYGIVTNLVGLALTVGLIAGTVSLLTTETLRRGIIVSDGTKLFIAIAVTAPLALRDRHPLGAWRLSLLAMALINVDGWLTVPYVPAGTFVAIVCVYTVAVRCSRDITLGVGIISFAGVWLKDPETGPAASVLLLLPLTIGYAVRVRQTARRELAEQERRHLDAEAVLTERQRIARELHDVVAHHMSMIAIQAEAAPYKVEAVPDETRRDLAEIRATALDALTELRRILGVLRAEDGAETAPQPSLERIDELVANARGAGLRVETRFSGDLGGLPPGVGLTAYRILQEALSNAMRHAPGSRVDVEVSRDDGLVWLGVVNGPPGDGQDAGSPFRAAATGWSGCGSGPPRWAAS
ncbi:sensor histidine kinase [Actinomadura madurae]|uniref:sensor histidine kinase n=1 Tax=Actinomadura madurae TaxID=1993 RepID=UPI0020D2302D|nr:histidine kinase [Actinomadura madurae]MCP9949387.1 histidine kinase [Actinomadura madurae]MCP9966142.1 histidine kinase [Actinomadura madurae]MCP9978633.1 histidine kinase [Actinomadura madurae]MCQ0009847.1 histidine kinase [Actinomadura madurae]MCQ0014828.1 histidine kinase [Actinomadura madurae]